ncbi:MAG TPA: hypothetical protein VKZ53_12005 [Candidatus Angelobacter sp.]|nr:hypothetical protein [Candidatus Angelobacter sp.]
MNELVSANFLVFWLPLGIFAVMLGYILVHRQFRLSERTIDEVTVFLRRIDWDETREVFDLARERTLRGVLSDEHFRRTMRIRIHEVREFLSRMYHNVRVLHEWANTELGDILDKPVNECSERENQIRAIADRAAYFRVLTGLRLCKVTFWTLLRIERLPFVRIPSVAALRRCGEQGELDLVEMYGQLREAAGNLALRYGKQVQDDMLAVL